MATLWLLLYIRFTIILFAVVTNITCTIYRVVLFAMVRPASVVDVLFAFEAPNLLHCIFHGDGTAELWALRSLRVYLWRSSDFCGGFGCLR